MNQSELEANSPLRRPLEGFLLECRKTKTEVIALTNHSRRRQSNEPNRTQRKYIWPPPSAGKTRASKSRFGLTSDW